jgi:hypothetical protein
MPLYTLNIQPGDFGGGAVDDFADDAAATREANLVAKDLVRYNRPMSRDERVTVRDATGCLVYEAYLTVASMKL